MIAALALTIFHMFFLAADGEVATPDPGGAAEARWIARFIYDDLTQPSCSAPPGFSREAQLVDARAAVAAFEARAAGTGLAFQLAVARADVAYELANVGGCWVDDDIRFAEKHLEMTRGVVEDGLKMLTPFLALPSSALPALSAEDAAAFRAEVRDLERDIRPMCTITTRGDNDVITAPALAEAARFRQRIAGTPWALDYDLAEEDVVFQQRRVMVDCANPRDEAPDAVSAEMLADTRRRIAALELKMRTD